jgi:hypothetical protein
LNLPIAAVSVLMLLALLAHTLVGAREARSVRPSLIMPKGSTTESSAERLERNWAQSLCAFQLVTVDLLALTALSFLLAFTEVISPKKPIALALAGYSLLWGIAWLIQLAVLKSPRKNFFLLGHWVLWFLCAVLVYWGAQSL